MANEWMTALKAWNERKGGAWCIPKKGSKEYDEVMKFMTTGGQKLKRGGMLRVPDAARAIVERERMAREDRDAPVPRRRRPQVAPYVRELERMAEEDRDAPAPRRRRPQVAPEAMELHRMEQEDRDAPDVVRELLESRMNQDRMAQELAEWAERRHEIPSTMKPKARRRPLVAPSATSFDLPEEIVRNIKSYGTTMAGQIRAAVPGYFGDLGTEEEEAVDGRTGYGFVDEAIEGLRAIMNKPTTHQVRVMEYWWDGYPRSSRLRDMEAIEEAWDKVGKHHGSAEKDLGFSELGLDPITKVSAIKKIFKSDEFQKGMDRSGIEDWTGREDYFPESVNRMYMKLSVSTLQAKKEMLDFFEAFKEAQMEALEKNRG